MKEQSQPLDPFNFTEDEKRYDRISGERFWTLLGDEETVIHRVEVDSNDYGDFMFVTLSRPADDQRSLTTFCGMGYHKYRERWITDHWRWYQTSPRPQMLERQLTREEAEGLLRARQREIAPDAAKDTQTDRGKVYEILADNVGEASAIYELEDLTNFWKRLDANFE